MNVSHPDGKSSREEFLSQFAHDLRTPINHIIGYSEMLLEDMEADPGKAHLQPGLKRIHTAGKELLKVITAEMDTARESDTELGQILTHLSASVKTPLDEVMGYSERLTKDDEASLADDLQKINTAGRNIMTLISNGFDSAKLIARTPTKKKVRDTQPIVTVPGQDTEATLAEHGYVLVVDDNEDNRDILAQRLKREGYMVAVAEDAEHAFELIKTQKFDLLLLDIMMPGVSGVEMLSIIRKTRSMAELPIIMATAKDQTDDVVESLQRGANDYVTKPINLPILLARIQTQLRLKRLSQLKDEFLRIATHDLKNPLSTILLSAYLVRDNVKVGAPMTEQAQEMVSFIVKRGEQMERIIRDFLDLQAVDDGNLRLDLAPVDLNRLAQSTIEDNQQYADSKKIDLITELSTLPSVQADVARLSQVTQNLVGNAIKFSFPNTRTVIRTRVEDGHVIFEVVDSGPGLTADDMKRVFVKYARLSNKPTGTEHSSGLGLAICKQIIELHGGQIGVRNNAERGATFFFSLPLSVLP